MTRKVKKENLGPRGRNGTDDVRPISPCWWFRVAQTDRNAVVRMRQREKFGEWSWSRDSDSWRTTSQAGMSRNCQAHDGSTTKLQKVAMERGIPGKRSPLLGDASLRSLYVEARVSELPRLVGGLEGGKGVKVGGWMVGANGNFVAGQP